MEAKHHRPVLCVGHDRKRAVYRTCGPGDKFDCKAYTLLWSKRQRGRQTCHAEAGATDAGLTDLLVGSAGVGDSRDLRTGAANRSAHRKAAWGD